MDFGRQFGEFYYWHPVEDVQAGVIMSVDPYAPHEQLVRSAYSQKESTMQIEGYDDAGYGYQSPYQAHRTPLGGSAWHHELSRDYQARKMETKNSRRASDDAVKREGQHAIHAFQVKYTVGEPLCRMPYRKRSYRPWERDNEKYGTPKRVTSSPESD